MDNLTNLIADVGREADALDSKRPYNGQPHTHIGIRGKTLVEGLTMRDIVDCYYKAIGNSQSKPIRCAGNVYKSDWDQIDPIALAQNLVCNIEKAMGIFPNVPSLTSIDVPCLDLDSGKVTMEVFDA